MDTLTRKLNSTREKLLRCQKELKELEKQIKYKNSSTCESCNAFRKTVGSTSTDHKHKKRRMNRAQTPNNFWNLNF